VRAALVAAGALRADCQADDRRVMGIWRSHSRDERRWWKETPADLRHRAAAGALLVAGAADRDALWSAIDELDDCRPGRRRLSDLASRIRRMGVDDVLLLAGMKEGRHVLGRAAVLAERRRADTARLGQHDPDAAAAAIDRVLRQPFEEEP
jgi:hypothetical protein